MCSCDVCGCVQGACRVLEATCSRRCRPPRQRDGPETGWVRKISPDTIRNQRVIKQRRTDRSIVLPPSTGALVRVSAHPPAHTLTSPTPHHSHAQPSYSSEGTSADVSHPISDDIRALGPTCGPTCATVAHLGTATFTFRAHISSLLPPRAADIAGS